VSDGLRQGGVLSHVGGTFVKTTTEPGAWGQIAQSLFGSPAAAPPPPAPATSNRTHDRWITLNCPCPCPNDGGGGGYPGGSTLCDCAGGTVVIPNFITLGFGGLFDNCRWPSNMQALFDGDVNWNGPRENKFYSLGRIPADDPNAAGVAQCEAVYQHGTLAEDEVLDLYGLTNACSGGTLGPTVDGPRYAYIGQTTATSALGTTTIDAYLAIVVNIGFCEDPTLGKKVLVRWSAVYVMDGDSAGLRAFRVQMDVAGNANAVGLFLAPTCAAFSGGGILPLTMAIDSWMTGNSETYDLVSCGCLPALADCPPATPQPTMVISLGTGP
jgi:hypothetical protein